MRNIWRIIVRIPRWPILGLILAYQKTLSPDHSWLKRYFPHGYCKYYPSCSSYGYQAVDKLGITRGLWLAGWRVLRCNPWSRGGVDEI
jgi:hypothetical protein